MHTPVYVSPQWSCTRCMQQIPGCLVGWRFAVQRFIGLQIIWEQMLEDLLTHRRKAVSDMLSQSDALRFEEVFSKFSGKEFSNRIAIEEIEDALGEMKVKISAEG
jgi:hypothetical protein